MAQARSKMKISYQKSILSIEANVFSFAFDNSTPQGMLAIELLSTILLGKAPRNIIKKNEQLNNNIKDQLLRLCLVLCTIFKKTISAEVETNYLDEEHEIKFKSVLKYISNENNNLEKKDDDIKPESIEDIRTKVALPEIKLKENDGSDDSIEIKGIQYYYAPNGGRYEKEDFEFSDKNEIKAVCEVLLGEKSPMEAAEELWEKQNPLDAIKAQDEKIKSLSRCTFYNNSSIGLFFSRSFNHPYACSKQRIKTVDETTEQRMRDFMHRRLK